MEREFAGSEDNVRGGESMRDGFRGDAVKELAFHVRRWFCRSACALSHCRVCGFFG